MCNASTNGTKTSKTPTFNGCSFINVNPTVSLPGDKYPIYKNCVFSLTDASTDAVYLDGTTAQKLYLARVEDTASITFNGVQYPVNYALVADGQFLTVEWEDGTHPYWALGSSPISDSPAADVIEKLKRGEYQK